MVSQVVAFTDDTQKGKRLHSELENHSVFHGNISTISMVIVHSYVKLPDDMFLCYQTSREFLAILYSLPLGASGLGHPVLTSPASLLIQLNYSAKRSLNCNFLIYSHLLNLSKKMQHVELLARRKLTHMHHHDSVIMKLVALEATSPINHTPLT